MIGACLNNAYPESVSFLYALGNEYHTIKLGLERIRTLLEALGEPQRSCRFVHVAGTNGKGSTCAMLERTLRSAGVRTGLYTSPHLVEPTERIRIDGQPVSAYRENAIERLRRFGRRNAVLLLLLGAYLAVRLGLFLLRP